MNGSFDRRFKLKHEADYLGNNRAPVSVTDIVQYHLFRSSISPVPSRRPPSGSILVSKTDRVRCILLMVSGRTIHVYGRYLKSIHILPTYQQNASRRVDLPSRPCASRGLNKIYGHVIGRNASQLQSSWWLQ